MVTKLMLLCSVLTCALFSTSQHSLNAIIYGMHWYDEEDPEYEEQDSTVIHLEVEFFRDSARASFNGLWRDYQLVDVQIHENTQFFGSYFALYNEEHEEYHGFLVGEVNYNTYEIYKYNIGASRYAQCNFSIRMDGVPSRLYHERRYSVYKLIGVEVDKSDESDFGGFALANENFLAFYQPEGQGLFLANVMPKNKSQSFGPVSYVGERVVNGTITILLTWNYYNTYDLKSGTTSVELEKRRDGKVMVRIQPGTSEELRILTSPEGSWEEWEKWLE
jgi:hypothetical protein